MEMVDPVTLAGVDPGTLLLLPDKIGKEGRALYRDDNAGLVKTIRAEGASLEFAWPRDRRAYVSEFGAGEVIAAVTLGVVGNFTTDVIRYMYRIVQFRVAAALGRPVLDGQEIDEVVTFKVARFESSPQRRVIEGLECSGPVSGVIDLIKSLVDSEVESFDGEPDGQSE
ncbi:hypothetical protein IOD16_27160 [Saccharothrix sp. 6-C]|uniref:hypothetical protein n=1 Tax=Saccharothrix sp. 6-C TaxID=2781735 RepID=UPI001917101C|nr:hypothetical protein [Saccharothrix sp. 6-C]QQQ74795.1 hypothetical protein IOD16_27160 [Saccharothrix sp. 6-C]